MPVVLEEKLITFVHCLVLFAMLRGILRLTGVSPRPLRTVCETCQKVMTQQRSALSTTSRLFGIFEPTDLLMTEETVSRRRQAHIIVGVRYEPVDDEKPVSEQEGPDIPEYDVLNVRMQGHDYVTLESYVKYVHNFANRLGLDADVWPMPTKSNHIDTYKANSSIVEHTYDLHTFDRTLQLEAVPSTVLPLFLEVIRSHSPQGITITVKEPDEAEEEDRYIPDIQLSDLRSQMDDIQQAREERRKK